MQQMNFCPHLDLLLRLVCPVHLQVHLHAQRLPAWVRVQAKDLFTALSICVRVVEYYPTTQHIVLVPLQRRWPRKAETCCCGMFVPPSLTPPHHQPLIPLPDTHTPATHPLCLTFLGCWCRGSTSAPRGSYPRARRSSRPPGGPWGSCCKLCR